MNIRQLDVLLFHSINDYLKADTKKLKEVVSMLKEQNIVKSFGVSIYENSEVVNIDENIINVVQLPFNLLDNINLRGELIKSLKDRNIQVHVRSVFLQGLFFKDLENVREGEIKRALLCIREICELNSISIEKLALNYCLMQKDIDHVLIGVDSLAQLKRNIQFKIDNLPNACVDAINRIFIENSNEINPSKW
jgi:aryl-alcohol dehydrogenase-like predicted oxidoreductase